MRSFSEVNYKIISSMTSEYQLHTTQWVIRLHIPPGVGRVCVWGGGGGGGATWSQLYMEVKDMGPYSASSERKVHSKWV